MGSRTRIAVASLVIAVAAFIGVGGAAAGESLGPVPTELPVSRCAPLSYSPHVAKVGDTITATAGPPTDECGGPASSVSWEWGFAIGSQTIVNGCKPSSRTCVLRAETATGSPGHRYEEGCINGSSPFGGWESCDYYAVEGCGGAEASALDPGRHLLGLQVGVCCPEPEIATTARAVRGGREVEVTVLASRLGPKDQCGRATLKSNRNVVLAVRRQGQTETGHATLKGRAGCFADLTATVTTRGGTARGSGEVEDGVPVIQTARAHRVSSGVVLTTKLAHLRPAGTCGEVVLEAETAHASRSGTAGVVPVAHIDNFTGTSATAHVTLNRSAACLATTRVSATQGNLQTPTARAVRLTGKEPQRCTTRGGD